MATRTRWLIALCWIAVALLTFLAVDASSFRNWMYLTTVALVLPIVLIGVSHANQGQTIADVIRGGRS